MATPGRELRFVEATPDGRGYLMEVIGGPQHGTLIFLPGPPPGQRSEVTASRYVAPQVRYDGLSPTAQREAQATAERLLVSLLDDNQRHDYATTAGFWVELADGGQLRLGTLYHLIHRPASGPIAEQVLCVVPGHDSIGAVPPADIWTNLLLSLSADPDGFFRVANVLSTRTLSGPARAPGFTTLRIEELVTLARSHYRHGDWWNGALAEHELAKRRLRSGRRREALRCALPAALTIGVATPPGGRADRRSIAQTRQRVEDTARQAAPVAWSTPGMIEDLLALADARMRANSVDLGDRLDRERARLTVLLNATDKLDP